MQSPKPLRLAPIGLFVYRRANILPSVLASLRNCPEFAATDCFVFSDGPKNQEAVGDVERVRAIVSDCGMKNVQLIASDENRGLARSIEAGVGRLCDQYGRAIVLEDDLLVSPSLLAWFNAALDKYESDDRVFQISGHNFDVPSMRSEDCGFFVPMITSWGWATWARAWKHYQPDATGWDEIRANRSARRDFDLGGNYPYARMMEMQLAGKIDSWAIRWYLSVYRQRGLALFPPRTLVQNIGSDGAATHRGIAGRIRNALAIRRSPAPDARVPTLPEQVSVDEGKFRRLKRSIFWQSSKLSPLHWLTK